VKGGKKKVRGQNKEPGGIGKDKYKNKMESRQSIK